ncbi:hypothetical protein C8Q76DRAFT_571713, partial [Earliella scabrosa]
LSPPLDQISELIASRRIPVVVYDGQALSVRSADEGAYMAISHVWADGLGSTTEIGLPTCQIARIATYARQLVPDGAFWVDALCVPGIKELRKGAIRLMTETYRRAGTVVVFDARIRSLCTSTSPLKEIFFHINMSPWMQRIWTLSEAMLAQELYFEFADELVPIARLADAYKQLVAPIPTSLGELVPSDPLFQYTVAGAFQALMNRRSPGALLFSTISMLLKNRTTSKPEDETVAVAGLFGVDVAVLLADEEADARMRTFLLQLNTLPADVIFTPTMHSQKLPYPGFRWAPRTMTQINTGSFSTRARCTPDGL